MTIFNTFDESLFREFRSTTKEGLNDLGASQEEIDKIEFEISQSRHEIDLRVDYSDFSNHVFFGSALAAANFALSRLLNDYPIDGELKDKNEWKRINSGYENYFFDQYPKQQGYFYSTSGGANDSWIDLDDHEYKLRPGTGSVCFEAVIKVPDNISGFSSLMALYEPSETDGFVVLFFNKTLIWRAVSGSNIEDLTVSYDPYVSSSHMLSFVYDQPTQKQMIYVDGDMITSRSLSTTFGEIDLPTRKFYVGAAFATVFNFQFSGAIDDVRVWMGPTRKPELIKRNFFRPVHADVTGGLKLYYKFNETDAAGSNAIDYSGNGLHGVFSGSFSHSSNIVSGTLGSFFKDPGDPIFDLTNTRVTGFMDALRASGSQYDKENRNFIYNLVPSFFIDEGDEHEDMQRFLLLMARHYDRLKLYIEHLANVYNVDQGDHNNTPDELLGIVARHYGLDLANVYEGAGALEYFFGENVTPTGSLDSSIETIRNQLRRNLLSNLIYIIKTKSTREALEASMRSLGLDEEVVNINEYSTFSGGIQTSRTPRTVERRVARFLTSSNVHLTNSVYTNDTATMYEVRVLFNTASVYLTSSIFTIASGASGEPIYYLDVERENLTSAFATAKLYHSGATPLTSSLLSMFDNNWINFATIRSAGDQFYTFTVAKLNRDELEFSSTVLGALPSVTASVDSITTASLGSRNGTYFDGWMQEFRAWSNLAAAGDVSVDRITEDISKHALDFESVAFGPTILGNLDSLTHHLKLNDFTGSESGIAPTHNYIDGTTGSFYSGLSSSAVYNFPGKYISKLEPSYSYDFGINNDKIRLREEDTLTINDLVKDVPYLSVDMSPVISLNREIIRWFGDLEKFNNLIGKPYLRYREEVDTLNDLRYHFFNSRMNGKINFRAYLNLLKWFDSNFAFFLGQLMPLDLGSSLSNFVVESHLLEHNQVPRVFPFKKGRASTEITGAISTRPLIDIALTGENLPLGDPGRFGAAVSASAEVVTTETFAVFFSSSVSGTTGINFRREIDRRILTDLFQENSHSHAPEGYGNGWYITQITGANYLKSVLNVDPEFYISGVHYLTGAVTAQGPDGSTTLYLTANAGRPLNTHYTGTFAGVQDSTWMWYNGWNPTNQDAEGPTWSYGIGYGGAWGQLPTFNNRGRRATVLDLSLGETTQTDDLQKGLGGGIVESFAKQTALTVIEETETTKTHVLWPSLAHFEPIFIQATGSNGSNDPTGSIIPLNPTWTGGLLDVAEHADFWSRDIINIKDFRQLSIHIAAKRISQPTANDTPIKFVFKFQFFDKDLPGADEIEGALSSSFVATGSIVAAGTTSKFISERVDHEYVIEKFASSSASQHSFRTSFERELPKTKYMRTYVRIEYPKAADNQVNTGYKVLIKGVLHKDINTLNATLLSGPPSGSTAPAGGGGGK